MAKYVLVIDDPVKHYVAERQRQLAHEINLRRNDPNRTTALMRLDRPLWTSLGVTHTDLASFTLLRCWNFAAQTS